MLISLKKSLLFLTLNLLCFNLLNANICHNAAICYCSAKCDFRGKTLSDNPVYDPNSNICYCKQWDKDSRSRCGLR
ncbi:hypothetical protein [Candidatus Babela massiliensis]|uniref:hypothetical protein n=1 Tax=Candidatus Babela massiliensis TaxID=673862 RepID=UPI0005C89DFB|nr:hypothetical protein [Candidatus Babela massiliensis]